jgi:hypothetical protein
VIVEFISRSTDLAVQCEEEISRATPPKRRAARTGRIA